MITTNRTKYQSFLDCPRKRWLGWEVPNGTAQPGLMRAKVGVPLATGSFVHHLSEAIHEQQLLKASAPHDPLEDAIADAQREYAATLAERGLEADDAIVQSLAGEQQAIAEALMRAWWRVRRPQFAAEYEVLAVEQERPASLSAHVTLQTRADMIVRRRADGAIFVWSWKTTGYVDGAWQEKWECDLQWQTEALPWLATEWRPTGVIVEGLYKGRKVKKDAREGRIAYGEFGPPLAWAWGRDLPTGPRELSATYKPKWLQVPMWLEPGGVREWIASVPDEVLAEHFIQTAPILIDEERIRSVAEQIETTERYIEDNITGASAQNFTNCLRFGAGARCEFYDICHHFRTIGTDPIGSGLYVPRVSHHAAAVAEETE